MMQNFKRKRNCYFTDNGIEEVDYKDIEVLKKFLTESGKIIPMRFNGVKSRYQRQLSSAIRRARFLSLIPYCDSHR